MAKNRVARYKRETERSKTTPAPPSRAIIVADASKQAPNNSYVGRSYYEDLPFVCEDCGKAEVWTARQQKWWYEVAKGSIYSTAKRCRACRKRWRESSPADKNPVGLGQLMKLVRDAIEPALLAAGFAFDARNKPRDPAERVWVDYSKARELFSFSVKPGTGYIIAELLDQSGACQTIAKTDFNNPTTRAAVMATVTAFASAVSEFMARPAPAP
ncbi:MAG TPA: zinc-ribbon domain-containing protein [Pirellulales bacterium]|nr:zinc-ribbon domain-containing protein [Pirellulales bacterium]